ncbi:hypothetical protein BYT27DRAFT_7206031 [Phlegmacium glaucopus]|nr:hypothetical protein BYT27DRAFT_7206031 [Phlegmacium glaucopus]
MVEAIRKHDSLYFCDGNIALITPHDQSPNHYVAFRLHRSRLSLISPVFEGLFMVPVIDNQEIFDGVPLIYMMDGADALECLFRLVYSGINPPFERLNPRTLPSLRHILALANKYAIDYLRTNIVDQIERDWPLTLR